MAVSGVTTYPSKNTLLHTWDTLTVPGFGTALDVSRYEERTFDIKGDSTVSAGHAEMWGSNTVSVAATGTWGQLHTYSGNLVSGAGGYIIRILDNPRWIAPYLVGSATGATGVSVNTSVLARG